MAEGVVLSGTHLTTDLEMCLPLQGHGMEETLKMGTGVLTRVKRTDLGDLGTPHILKESEGCRN